MLVTLLGYLEKIALGWLADYINKLITNYRLKQEQKQASAAQAAANTAPEKVLTPDTTTEKVDEAIDSSLNHF